MNKFLEYLKRIFKLEEKVNNIIRFGTIKEVDGGNNLVVVDLGNKTESPKLPYLVNSSGNATVYFVPKIGDQVILFSKNGEISQGFIVPAIYKGNVAGVDDEWRLEFASGSINYKEGRLEIKANTEIQLDAPKAVLAGETGGGVVCQNHLCSFSGTPHPEGSTKVFAER